MDRNEKNRLRASIDEHLPLLNCRLTDDDALLLVDLIDNYDEFRGRREVSTSIESGWSSDGKYTRTTTTTQIFTDNVGIRVEHEYSDDDGQRGESVVEISDARGVLDWIKGRR